MAVVSVWRSGQVQFFAPKMANHDRDQLQAPPESSDNLTWLAYNQSEVVTSFF